MTKKQLQDQIQEKGRELRRMHDCAIAEKREMTKEENAKFDEISNSMTADQKSLQRMEFVANLELNKNIENQKIKEGVSIEEQRAKILDAYIRTGNQPTDSEYRDVTKTAAGVVGTINMASDLIKQLTDYTGILEAGAKIINTENSNTLNYPVSSSDGVKGRIVGEGAALNVVDKSFTTKPLEAYKYTSDIVKISFEMLQDASYNIIEEINRLASESIGLILNEHTTSGDGTGKPQGVLDGATNTVVSSGASLVYDDLVKLQTGVPIAYRNRPNSCFMVSDSVMTDIRLLKDSNNHPLWTPPFAGQPEQILNRKILINNELLSFADPSTSPVAIFGDPNEYIIRYVGSPRYVRLNELFAANDVVGFTVFQQIGGMVRNGKAFAKLLKA